MEGVRFALLLSTAERYVALLTNFICIVVVSRLMTPDEVGVSVVGMAVMVLALSAREFVSTNYLIQARTITKEDVQTAFTMMTVFTLVMSFIIYFSAPTIAVIYENAGLVSYLRIVTLAFAIEVFSAPVMSLFRREMAFGKIATINITSNAVSTVLVIILAEFGFSYMSFAWGWFATATLTCVLSLIISPRLWVFTPCLSRWRMMLTFGGYNGAITVMHRLSEQLPFLLLGRLLSLHHVAIYSRSLLVCQLPDRVILGGAGAVILPAFAAEVRKGRDLKAPYLMALEIVSGILWPALCLLAILAEPVVIIVLGNQWLEAVPLVRIIAFALIFSLGFDLNYPILVSLGAVRDMFLRTLIVAPISVLITFMAAFIGLKAVAYSLFIIMPFQALVSLYFIRKHINVPWNELAKSLQPSLVVALCGASAAFAMTLAVPLNGIAILPIFLCISSGLAGWLFGLWLTAHPLTEEIRHILGWLQLARSKQSVR
ncbi:sugar transporter [Nitratireductor aestuarii]|uniref:Sugar transporter n=1 Tax=Nitratireductor aestuarii TaxID=1735103 RepID=A0A916REF3_9HYPH|nr:oligosaccharide flippase family protein [Nitratireductor aestuarii]GGA53533.1 sugar transporter [Nitratireductor aestuarii]